jgi:hypothetical protein
MQALIPSEKVFSLLCVQQIFAVDQSPSSDDLRISNFVRVYESPTGA